MLPFLSLALLALAVSLDGFGVGVMYGLRKIRIPAQSIAIIALCSGLVIFASMQLGVWTAKLLPPAAAKAAGAAILIGVGLWAIVQMARQRPGDESSEERSCPERAGAETGPDADAAGGATEPAGGIRTVLRIELKRLGFVIEILRTPSLADVDRSGNISASEAVLLGAALSLDAFGAGIGAAFVGFAPLLTASVIALASGFFLSAGLKVGLAYADTRWLRRLSVLPGCILIVMGVMKLM